MTQDPQGVQGRFDGFDEVERDIIRFALQQVAKRIMDRAAADDYEQGDLTAAAATFHLASTLSNEVGVTLGEPAPSDESLDIVASCIALGETPLAARMAAEVEAT